MIDFIIFYLILQQKGNSKLMSKVQKMQSTVSVTSQSLPITPPTQPSILSSTPSHGVKKFVRKRDTSTDSLRRNTPQMVKANKTNANISLQLQIKEKEKQKNDLILKRVNQVGFNQTIKNPGYMKLYSGQLQTQRTDRSGNQGNSKCWQNDVRIQTPTVKQNLYAYSQTQKLTRSRIQQRQSNQYRTLNTSRNLKLYKAEPPSPQPCPENSSCPQTLRESAHLPQKSSQNEIKILENEILILQDENSRLKKQIVVLTAERDAEKKNRNALENQKKVKDKEIKEFGDALLGVFRAVEKEVQEAVLQIQRCFGDGTCLQKRFISQTCSPMITQLKNPPTNRNTVWQPMHAYQQKISQFFCQIHKTIQANHKYFSKQRIEFDKSQIKQDILLRSEMETKALKNQIKTLNQKINFEKERCNRFKEMYEKIKKLNIQLRNISNGKKSKGEVCSEGFLGDALKAAKLQPEEECSFELSDYSDEEGARAKKSLRKIK